MPRDISGVYTLPPGNPVQPRTIPVTNWANVTMADIAAALNGIPGGAIADDSITPPKLKGMSSNGLVTRISATEFAESIIAGTADQIVVTNGGGVADHPKIGIANNPTLPGLVTLGGGQLKFPATQVPSTDPNTLDDYEEGTWTPTITFATPGDLSVAYALRFGRYTKIGNRVYIDLRVITSSFTHSTASGAFQISGLPFTTASGDGYATLLVGFTGSGQLAGPAGSYAAGLLGPNRSVFDVYFNFGSGASQWTAATTPSGVTQSYIISGSYQV